MELQCEICGQVIDSDEHNEDDIVFCSLECVEEFERLEQDDPNLETLH